MDLPDPRLLATMPLHAITSTYGEAGLRQRFAAEISSFPPAERERLERALSLAGRLHADDRRQREPYVNHLLRVATRIIAYYGVRDADVICAALLHDAVEDHPGALSPSPNQQSPNQQSPNQQSPNQQSPNQQSSNQQSPNQQGGGQQAALEVLAARFGPRVAELVAAVTNPQYVPGRDTHEQYREHVAASLATCPWARVIKASDFTDNGVGLIHTTGPKVERLAGKYGPLVPVLRELIARPDTPLSGEAKARIFGQLDQAAQRFAIIRDTGAAGLARG